MPYDVLTPAQAAEYLQVAETVVVQEAEAGRIPGRKIGTEWRFLRLTLFDWLNATPQSTEAKPLSSKERLLAIAGAWKGYDEDPEEFMNAVYRVRKKPPVRG